MITSQNTLRVSKVPCGEIGALVSCHHCNSKNAPLRSFINHLLTQFTINPIHGHNLSCRPWVASSLRALHLHQRKHTKNKPVQTGTKLYSRGTKSLHWNKAVLKGYKVPPLEQSCTQGGQSPSTGTKLYSRGTMSLHWNKAVFKGDKVPPLEQSCTQGEQSPSTGLEAREGGKQIATPTA